MILHRPYDRWLLTATVILVGVGALMIYSSTSVVTPSLARKNVSQYHYFTKHIFTVALGFMGMFCAYKVRPDFIRKMALPLLLLSLGLLVLVFTPGFGVSAGGARRWIRLWPSTFQPSELVKLAMVVFVAWYVSMDQFRHDRFVYFAVPVVVMGAFQVIFLKQPDFGAAMSLGVLTVGMLFVSGARVRYLASLVILCVPVLVKLLMEPYRLKRITAFLDPWKHSQDSGFQLVQSFIALGSGGLGGVGLGESRQKLDFLPEVHTDFIFSILGEELGFIAAALVVMLFAFIFVRGVLIASRMENEFYRNLGFGLSMMIAFQAMVNFMVVVGLLPTKGLPLPFISYGGSALLVNMVAIGILLNISRLEPRQVVTGTDDREALLGERLKRKRAMRSIYGVRR